MASKTDKLSPETELDAHYNSTIWTLKPGHQTFVSFYSTHNHSIIYGFNQALKRSFFARLY